MTKSGKTNGGEREGPGDRRNGTCRDPGRRESRAAAVALEWSTVPGVGRLGSSEPDSEDSQDHTTVSCGASWSGSCDRLPSPTELHCTPHPALPPAVNSPGLLHSHLRAFVLAYLLLEMVFLPDILWFLVPGYYFLSEIFLGHVKNKCSHAHHFMRPFSAFF